MLLYEHAVYTFCGHLEKHLDLYDFLKDKTLCGFKKPEVETVVTTRKGWKQKALEEICPKM